MLDVQLAGCDGSRRTVLAYSPDHLTAPDRGGADSGVSFILSQFLISLLARAWGIVARDGAVLLKLALAEDVRYAPRSNATTRESRAHRLRSPPTQRIGSQKIVRWSLNEMTASAEVEWGA